MIDSIILSPSIHLAVGSLVLLANTLFLVVSGWLVLRKAPLNRLVHATAILFQLILMIQALLGIKLLDQGLGVLQLYIHYLGGLAPLFFCLLFYWLPESPTAAVQSRRLLIVAALSLFFTVLTFTVGRSYVAEGMRGREGESAMSDGLDALEGDPTRGEDLYITCAGCHGSNGVGIDGLGVALQQNDFIRTRSDGELVAYIKAGRAADALGNRSGVAMPSWGGNPSLSEQNLIDIVAYLRLLEGNKPNE